MLFDNSSLGMVRAEMMVAGYPFFGTEVQNPNFAAVASAMGIHEERVDGAEDVPGPSSGRWRIPSWRSWDVTTDPNALAMPPKKTFGEVKGSLWR